MILGPISYLDCLVFCTILTPQLIIHVGLFQTVWVVLKCLPFLLLKLPYSFIHERFLVRSDRQSPFVQKATPFEDFVIRCVRYAFTNIPPKVGRVFFSKPVALPFLKFRILRHGYLRTPIHWNEYKDKRFEGIWIIKDPMKKPDICVFYAHGMRIIVPGQKLAVADNNLGGGFSMGSAYFYLEFLLTWINLLGNSGYQNPAIFALDYTLVPDASFPTQLEETIAAYEHVLSAVGDPNKICVSGDSAGATIVLSLLLHLANISRRLEKMGSIGAWRLAKPGMALLISPWVPLVSSKHQNTASDYLDAGNLHQYARQYAGENVSVNDSLLSPGNCRDISWWKRAIPSKGIFIAYGAEEVFAPEIADLVGFFKANDIKVHSREEKGGIHAWPVACLFLSSSLSDRQKGLKYLVEEIRENID
ncbi:alpha/beta-hydrolase [Rostrohypoxylon terebratum]|nr:alpha/beta-hydrolase [Rostrohypoxylon terebratum]